MFYLKKKKKKNGNHAKREKLLGKMVGPDLMKGHEVSFGTEFNSHRPDQNVAKCAGIFLDWARSNF